MPGLPDDQGNRAISQCFADETAILTIDLKAIAKNYRFLRKKSGNAECAAVVKANAYGLGVEQVVTALLDEGCRTFFVANLAEARQVRTITADASLFNMGGLFPGTAEMHTELGVHPVLNTLEEIGEWREYCSSRGGNAVGAAIQFDTGMNRLGLKTEALRKLVRSRKLSGLNIILVMSHLACADEPEHLLNRLQLEHFREVVSLLPGIPASLCNSAGIFLGEDYHFDLVRPGIALYGARPRATGKNPMKPVVRLKARIAQIQDVPAGEVVGYGAVQKLQRPSRIATVSAGYADGIFRRLGSTDDTQKAAVYIADYRAPIVGRISMDLITVDVTDIPSDLTQRGKFVELIGPHVSVEDIAEQAGTIGYEILTSLGRRNRRIYG